MKIELTQFVRQSLAKDASCSLCETYGIYNFNASPTMTYVTATASTNDHNYGIANVSGSSPTMTNVTATASSNSGEFQAGVFNWNSSPTMINVTATGVGYNGPGYGIRNNYSSPIISYSTATGSDHGVFNLGTSSTKIDHSVIKGYYSIYGTGFVANTKLDGPISVGSTFTCVGTYDENYVALNTSCQ